MFDHTSTALSKAIDLPPRAVSAHPLHFGTWQGTSGSTAAAARELFALLPFGLGILRFGGLRVMILPAARPL